MTFRPDLFAENSGYALCRRSILKACAGVHVYSSGQKLSAAFCAFFYGKGGVYGSGGENALRAAEAVSKSTVMFNMAEIPGRHHFDVRSSLIADHAASKSAPCQKRTFTMAMN